MAYKGTPWKCADGPTWNTLLQVAKQMTAAGGPLNVSEYSHLGTILATFLSPPLDGMSPNSLCAWRGDSFNSQSWTRPPDGCCVDTQKFCHIHKISIEEWKNLRKIKINWCFSVHSCHESLHTSSIQNLGYILSRLPNSVRGPVFRFEDPNLLVKSLWQFQFSDALTNNSSEQDRQNRGVRFPGMF